ncbi:MAG: hypothetical protein GEV13_13570 [Rhodospirillales bacterium]|nr:hypothetical protein [Rhodospirillales bacterium]
MAEMSPLRRRMIEDMTVRNLSPATQRSYLYAVTKFSRYFSRSPDRLSVEDVRAFQVHLVSTGISWPALNQTVCALRFFYGVTLGQAEIPERIPYAREPRKLPVVLNADEVVRFLEAVASLKTRTALTTAYWVWVVRGSARPPTAVVEHWGAGRFLGIYPIKGGLGVVAATPTRIMGPDAVGRDGRKVKAHFAALGDSIADVMASLPDDLGQTFWWHLTDARSENWIKGRVVLLGDAACAFLPTAGVGASMALESAAVLDDELGRTDARFLPGALARYELRRKPRAETFQDDSRRLASMMMIESLELSWGRDQLMKFYTLDMLAKNIAQSLAKPI